MNTFARGKAHVLVSAHLDSITIYSSEANFWIKASALYQASLKLFFTFEGDPLWGDVSFGNGTGSQDGLLERAHPWTPHSPRVLPASCCPFDLIPPSLLSSVIKWDDGDDRSKIMDRGETSSTNWMPTTSTNLGYYFCFWERDLYGPKGVRDLAEPFVQEATAEAGC